ncbi:nuclear transport factor 2 family protein [Sphingobium nicotianae]|uniref:Nuclear transport factor 2 family protein n=1 Tax=Sphingobium nicotianae TaxID=2782607 RepID=A0A9X1DB00_9SPHN|nr:nuclear transport factor 2 family protein [Sphingobium nicotianae]MBT2186438.1 nuclear transport factor 2 family protein [Sphingobium nicotianae]
MIRWILTAALVAMPVAAGAQPRAKALSAEQRLERAESELAIDRVLVDYAYYLDTRDYDHYVGLFTPDAEWVNPAGTHKGQKAIHDMLSGMLGPAMAENHSNYHIITNPRVDVTGNTATAWSRFLFVMRGEGGHPQPALAGIYRDEFVKLNGVWKIKRRVAENVMPTPDEWKKATAPQAKP